MNNNKQSMKLYTEEEVNKAMLLYIQKYPRITIFAEHITPIKLPSDEEIEQHVEESNSSLEFDTGFKYGAEWMRDKIQGGNK